MRGPVRILAVLAVPLLLAMTRAGTPAGPHPSSQYLYPVSLNEILTNGMSDIPEVRRMDEAVDSFMRVWDIRGASLAITRNDSLLYAKGYGWAEKERGRPMTPGTTLRLASVSKLITAIGIMVLQERGALNIQSPVFGPFGILNEFDDAITDDDYYLITVEHLLRHQGGFTRRYGDPMFSTLQVMRQFRLSTPPDAKTLTRKLVSLPLDFEPGTSQNYSNFGYLLLSMIIEKVSGMSYEAFIQENVLRKAGCFDFHIAGNYYRDRWEGETRYYPHKDCTPVPEFTGSGQEVNLCYGGNNITGTLGAGAWVGSSAELARLVASIDGDIRVPDILGFFSIYQMTQRLDDETFPLGWLDCKDDGEWTRTGSFTGTSALIKRYPDGTCWIFVTNTSTWVGPNFSKHVSGLFRSLRNRFSASLPEHDLFLAR